MRLLLQLLFNPGPEAEMLTARPRLGALEREGRLLTRVRPVKASRIFAVAGSKALPIKHALTPCPLRFCITAGSILRASRALAVFR